MTPSIESFCYEDDSCNASFAMAVTFKKLIENFDPPDEDQNLKMLLQAGIKQSAIQLSLGHSLMMKNSKSDVFKSHNPLKPISQALG